MGCSIHPVMGVLLHLVQPGGDWLDCHRLSAVPYDIASTPRLMMYTAFQKNATLLLFVVQLSQK